MRVGVLGSGSWGTALAQVLADNGHEVLVYGVVPEEIEDINLRHKNRKFFGDAPVHEGVRATLQMGDLVSYQDAFVLVVPTQFITSVLEQLKPYVTPRTIVINASKGFEWTTNERITDCIRRTLSDTAYAGIASLIGPSHAEEVIARMLTSVTSVSQDAALAVQVQQMFSNGYLRVYTGTDEIGAEYGVAIKNIIAIASGVLEGQGYGDNAKAALITRGLQEMLRYGMSKGADRDTFFGLTGVGDLIVTCFSPHSRNYRAGLEIGRADSAEVLASNTSTVEGVHSCKSVYEDAKKHGIDMPIVRGMYYVLFEGGKPSEVIAQIMQRPLRSEM